jgi:hypothetical protein
MNPAPLSLYNPDAPINDRIYYLKHYETYDPAFPVNPKMEAVIRDLSSNAYMETIADAILHCRAIRDGRGLRDLTYSYLWTIQQKYPLQAVFLLYQMMEYRYNKQVGSWRDVRAYADFVARHSPRGRDDPIINPVLGLYNNQIIKDREAMKKNAPISYAAKWTPRERKYPWMFEKLLNMWIFVDPEAKQMATERNRCAAQYRKLVSRLNTILDTTEIKECAGKWAEIVPENVPVNHKFASSAALERHGVTIQERGYYCDIPSWKLVKKMLHMNDTAEIDKLNAQWKKRILKNNHEYAYYVPLVDVSQPMYDNGARSLYQAIGLGCEIAEKSFFGRRVMAFSPKPYWVDLDNCEFGEMVRRIISAVWTPDNYLDGAFASVLDAVLFADMTPEEVLKLKVVLITNRTDNVSLPAHIVEAWSQAGIHKFGRPFLLNGHNFEKISV